MGSLYQIQTQNLLARHAPGGLESLTGPKRRQVYEAAINELVEMVRDGRIVFPFQQYFRLPAKVLFANLQQIDLVVTTSKSYRLYSYYPRYGTYLPPQFRGVPTTINAPGDLYEMVDVLSDLFIEDIRLRAKRYDQPLSTLECWGDETCLRGFMSKVLENPEINPQTLRRAIYESNAETNVFNPTWAKALIKTVMGSDPHSFQSGTSQIATPDVAGKKWLDISAGWGDRLLTAMALNMDYVGFDPNIDLKTGHTRMIELFGDPHRHQVIYEPFETAEIPPGPYDVIQSSPPYFDVEDYVPGQVGQSIVTYPEFDQWMVWFLFGSLTKAWSNLKPGGYLILHLGDTRTRSMSEATNIYLENYLPDASWEGIIGISSEAGYPRPVWVWQKVLDPKQRKLWEPNPKQRPFKGQAAPLSFQQRTMFNTYPEFQIEIIKYLGAKVAPDYTIRRQNARTIKDYVAANLPKIDPETIDQILSDTLLISSMLETQPLEQAIQSLTDLVDSVAFAGAKRLTVIAETTAKLADSNYWIRRQNGAIIRENLKDAFAWVEPETIDQLMADDLMLSSVLEQLEFEETIQWARRMILITFPR